jgi:hypothetical protein
MNAQSANPESTLMPLATAADELSQLAYDFHNDMLDRGKVVLTPREWIDEFRSWLLGVDFRSVQE